MSARILKGVTLTLLFLLLASTGTLDAALKPEYRRNGECYLLIGEGPAFMRGIYRLNNPEADKYFNPPKYLFKPDSSIGFSVDLDRKIYTFSEKVVPGYTLIPGNIPRQVIDDAVSANLADYGYHQYIHYDHRSWGKNTNVYRTGPAGRGIRSAGGTWPNFRSAGPGTPIGAQPADVLPSGMSIPLGVYPGRNWYAIPNGAWFSSWRTKPCQPSSPGPAGYFHVVYGDKEVGQPHNWTLYTYTPDDINADAPNYSSNAGQVVAVSYDKRITRQIFAGCLDGCGGASGSGSGVADPMVTDLAFMPPIKSNPSRTYFYSRPVGKSAYTITKNNSLYAPPSPTGNPIIGSPSNTDTYWIGVSLRNASSDYVYTIGTQDIRTWYNQATSSSGSGINIDAVTVSNQWNQKGGIVFAYDKAGKIVYKFIRYENDPLEPPISSSRYEGIDVQQIFSMIGADSTGEIDDIKADGFGSLFFALTFPSKNVATYDPRVHFKVNDCIMVYPDPDNDSEDEEHTCWLIYRQEYSKSVFEKSIYSAVPKEIGKKVFAERYYNLNVRIAPAGLTELVNSGLFPHNNVENILSSWSAKIGNNDGIVNKDDYNYGSLGLFYEYNFGDPGHAKLAVINVPTPPEVISQSGKNSFLDICGPYTDIPVSTDINSTQQDQNLIIPAPAKLSLDTLYYYMVENYPLVTGAWNPNDQPDWDGDGKHGGFISAIDKPSSSTSGGSVAYRWRTWMVEDLYGNPVYPPEPYPTAAPPKDGSNTGQENFTFFYTPVRGKFILTCQVIYDWYDYDLLPFGSTIDDLPTVYRPNTKALPVSPSGYTLYPASAQLNAIMSTPEFNFMTASASGYISAITEGGDEYFAVTPIVAGIGTDTPVIPSDLIARIERCDGWAPNNKNNPAHWFPAQTSHKPANAPEGYHGLKAGKPYFWRIALASQTILFDDISNPSSPSRAFITGKMMNPEYDASGNQINTLYVNYRDKVKFDNNPGDIRWMDNEIRLEAYLEYAIPDENGDPKVVKLPLLNGSSTTAIPSNFPVIASTPESLPPTDPFFADLVIKMSRTVSYDMWVKNSSGMNLFPVKKLPLPFTLYGKTKVLIVDCEAPKILYAHTKPVQLFGDAGFPLKVGDGPIPNPASVSIRLSDNNPWEAVDKVYGITSLSEYNNNKNNNDNPKTTAPTASFNYRPVFAKTLNRKVSISFDRAARIETGGMKLFPPTYAAPSDDNGNTSNFASTFSEMYTHKFKLSGGNCIPVQDRFQREFQSTKEVINGTEKHFATIGYRLPLNFIRLNSKDPNSNALPKGYANNSTGYYEQRMENGVLKPYIKPYLFYISATDSSGNSLGTKELNLCVHPRDVHRPNPWGFFVEHKNSTTSYFPIKGSISAISNSDADALNNAMLETPKNVGSSTYLETFNDDSAIWQPDHTAKGYINGQVNYYQSLAQLDTDIVKNFTGNSAYDYYKAQIDEKVPPAFIEDNVEFTIGCGVSDNAGIGVATLTFKYIDKEGTVQTREIGSSWETRMVKATSTAPIPPEPDIASTTGSGNGLFRGKAEDFPMSIPVTITCEDNALDWDYYTGNGGALADANNPWSDWVWGPFVRGAAKKNTRTFKTSIPVYGTNLIIRTIDKGLRNK